MFHFFSDERGEAVMLRTTYFMKGFGLFVIRKSPMDPSEPSLSFLPMMSDSNFANSLLVFLIFLFVLEVNFVQSDSEPLM
ncbi:Uncharacterized protein TCM_004568 [Theobroma cacao]|uniref:Uncharacterized protein n=1 Tax=Theobroma cacao TaxID=3641 RepID=A0A061DQI3_THECC|nr:Uncharacterized protein TCM_004568 [Theobroma cacao]